MDPLGKAKALPVVSWLSIDSLQGSALLPHLPYM